MGVVIYLILFFVSVILHELGHFVAAKCFGIRVTKFCVFFDWGFHLLSTGKRFATEYRLGWLPFGGYVKFDNGEGGEQPKWSFTAQQPWKRFVVYLAGVTVNLLVAYSCLFFCVRSVLPSKYFPSTFVMQSAAKCMVGQIEETKCYIVKRYLPDSSSDSKSENAPKPVKRRYEAVVAHFPPAQQFIFYTLRNMADLNLFLFLFNLLPIPILDGANCLYSLYEMVFRHPVNEKVKIILTLLGFVLIVGLTAFDVVEIIQRFV